MNERDNYSSYSIYHQKGKWSRISFHKVLLLDIKEQKNKEHISQENKKDFPFSKIKSVAAELTASNRSNRNISLKSPIQIEEIRKNHL